MSGPEKTHFIVPFLILLFHSFCPHFWEGPWTLLCVAAGLEGSASYSYHFDHLVSTLTASPYKKKSETLTELHYGFTYVSLVTKTMNRS